LIRQGAPTVLQPVAGFVEEPQATVLTGGRMRPAPNPVPAEGRRVLIAIWDLFGVTVDADIGEVSPNSAYRRASMAHIADAKLVCNCYPVTTECLSWALDSARTQPYVEPADAAVEKIWGDRVADGLIDILEGSCSANADTTA
jgi:hypothetical protein